MNTDPADTPPPDAVLDAFGGYGDPVRLDGGQGRTWRRGDVVLKPSGFAPESNWRADRLHNLHRRPPGRRPRPVRIALPVRPRGAAEGGWLVEGWEGWEVVEGAPDPRRLDEVLRAGSDFAAIFAGLGRPAFLDLRDDAWTYGERVAFGELPVPEGCEWTGPLRELMAAWRPVDELRNYVVHGDLLGNVLFADGLPPAVIDWAVYFRPESWAQQVAVIDAVTWGYAPLDRLDRQMGWHHAQDLLRALVYRMATNVRGGTERPDDYRDVCAAVLHRLEVAEEPPGWFREKLRGGAVAGLWIGDRESRGG